MVPRLLRPRTAATARVLALVLLLLPTAAAAQPAERRSWPDGVAYEIFVQSFADADRDGIGDIPGMTERLDYLADLGVRAVWLMPIGPSPSYHKYDVLDYRAIHPDYGTMDDFKTFVREAHERDIAVIIDLVVNHTGREHPWFRAAVEEPEGPYHDYYVWATPEEVAAMGASKEVSADSDNRIVWHAVDGRKERYYGFFGGHMPDLNFDNPSVRQEIIDIGRFWLEEVGVDGFRLDAAKHIFPDDRAPDNHAWWVEFREAMQATKPDVYLVGEVWASSDIVAPYLRGLTALFNFDLGYAITDAVRTGAADSLVIRLEAIRDFYQSIDSSFTDAIFLTNHDQNRIRSVLGGDLRKAGVAASILLTLPGSPFVYYGEEIGMLGQKPDEHIREPFLWGAVPGVREATWIEPIHSTPASVTPAHDQQADPSSLLNHYKRLIALRNGSAVLTRGEIARADVAAAAVVSFLRTLGEERVWVLHNVSGEEQVVDVPAPLRAFGTITFESDAAADVREGRVVLPPYGSAVLEP